MEYLLCNVCSDSKFGEERPLLMVYTIINQKVQMAEW